MVEITDIDDERVSHYRSLKFTPKQHIDEKIFIAEGRRVVEKLLKSNLEIISFFATKEFYDHYKLLIESHNISEDKKFFASKSLMQEVVGFRIHTGIMAIAKQASNVAINDLSNTIIAVDGVVDSENIGAIIRNVAAFNFDSFIYDKSSTSPYLRRAVRVSMGTVFNVKVSYSDDLLETLLNLKNMDYSIISAEIAKGSLALNTYNFSEKKVIVFGNEANGVSQRILDASDAIVHIPINSSVPSINVAASSAVFLNFLSNQKD